MEHVYYSNHPTYWGKIEGPPTFELYQLSSLHKSFCLDLFDGIPTTPNIGYIHALCPVFYSVWSVSKPPFV